ncbi:hypothetical protein N339_11551, partial [Pterocles gutturalis]
RIQQLLFLQTSFKKKICAFRFHLLSPSVRKVKYKPRDQRT